MTINKNASHIGIIEWKQSGRKNSLYIGFNTNTGETIIWQQMLNESRRPARVTGRNIPKFLGELEQALDEGDCFWIQRNDAVINSLRQHME